MEGQEQKLTSKHPATATLPGKSRARGGTGSVGSPLGGCMRAQRSAHTHTCPPSHSPPSPLSNEPCTPKTRIKLTRAGTSKPGQGQRLLPPAAPHSPHAASRCCSPRWLRPSMFPLPEAGSGLRWLRPVAGALREGLGVGAAPHGPAER